MSRKPSDAARAGAVAEAQPERVANSSSLAELRELHEKDGHRWPWRLEEDWTAEIHGADGSLIGQTRLNNPEAADLIIKSRNALPDLLSALERAEELEADALPLIQALNRHGHVFYGAVFEDITNAKNKLADSIARRKK